MHHRPSLMNIQDGGVYHNCHRGKVCKAHNLLLQSSKCVGIFNSIIAPYSY